jgi:hypothetical protein
MRVLELKPLRPPMRIADDMLRSVAFFGYADSTPGKGGIDCIGTGFFLAHEGLVYLVTAKHLSHDLGRDPFLVRLNKIDGTSENLRADNVEWLNHPDPTVDVSAVAIQIKNPIGYETMAMATEIHCFQPGEFEKSNVGIGNITCTIGLFRLLSGEKRNLPICHSGNIAMLPGTELVPVIDWTDPTGQRRIFVKGYLVEAQSLNGLSGSPVFVRSEFRLDFSKVMRPHPQKNRMPEEQPIICAVSDKAKLLGLWQGAWDAPPDEVLAVQTGEEVRVSVGIGIVVPYERIIEVFDMPEAKAQRAEIIAGRQTPAARLDSKARAKRDVSEASGDEANPQHLEDFKRLVDVAARKRPRGGQT